MAQMSSAKHAASVMQLASLYWDAVFRTEYLAHCTAHNIEWDGMWVLGPSFAPGVHQLRMPLKTLGCMGEGASGSVY